MRPRDILPRIMVKLTGHPRYRPDGISLNHQLITTRMFRLYEMVFGRRHGIRREAAMQIDDNGLVHYHYYSFEAVCSAIEVFVRSFWKIRLPVLVYRPVLITPDGQPIKLNIFSFAIALDTTADGGANTGSYSYTVTGLDALLLVGVAYVTTAPSVTYNSVSLTTERTINAASGYSSRLLYKIAPSTGSNTVGISGPSTYGSGVASYSGVLQSGFPDATGFVDGAVDVNPKTVTITVVASNCWVFSFFAVQSGTAGATMTTDKTDRSTGTFDGTARRWRISDSNGTVATGSQSIVGTGGGSTPLYVWGAMVSFAPSPPITTSSSTTSTTTTTTTSSSTTTTRSTSSTTSTTTTSSSTTSSTTTTSSSTTSTTSTSTSTTTTSSSTTHTTTITQYYGLSLSKKSEFTINAKSH